MSRQGIDVDPARFEAASRIVGADVVAELIQAGTQLSDGLSGCVGMAGTDPVGRAWASGYDRAVAGIGDAIDGAVGAGLVLADLLQRTGFNHAHADASSDPSGRTGGAAERAHYAPPTTARRPVLPPAEGSTVDTDPAGIPNGWWLVEHTVGYLWPRAHQDRLRAAAQVWSVAGGTVDLAVHLLADAITVIRAERSPEVAPAVRVCTEFGAQLRGIADACAELARAADGFAAAIDHAHHDATRELAGLIEWSAAIQGGGALLSLVGGEAIAQAAESARVAATALRVDQIIVVVLDVARTTATLLIDLADRIAAIVRTVSEIASARVVTAITRMTSHLSGLLSTHGGVEAFAFLGRLNDGRRGADTWASLRTLGPHFRAHAGDFGAVDEADYAQRASDFFLRGLRQGLPTKIDASGTIRIYDPASDTFGAYTSDGFTRTFFKPQSVGYWERQEGVLQ